MERITVLADKQIVLGVTGSIAAYKAVDLASKLTQAGAQVHVIMTEAARQFVTPLSFEAVTGRPVYTSMWQSEASGPASHIAHVGLGESADLFVIAPITANTMARLAYGMADDLLSVTALAARCPTLIAPAMDGGMFEHPATQSNLVVLRERGVLVVEPEVGRFASGLVGKGRFPETPTLLGHIRRALGRTGTLAGRHIVITAGGTREPIDPVRYITNRSSGKQGYALAQAALDAGANVTLISTVTHLPAPLGVMLVPVSTAEKMHDAVLLHSRGADALIMAAAVADFRPATVASQKIKKSDDPTQAPMLELTRTQDILMTVKGQRAEHGSPRMVIGFAAESQDLLANAQNKLTRKGLDLIVANDITASDAGFGSDTNRVVLLAPNAEPEPLELARKAQISEHILARIAARLNA